MEGEVHIWLKLGQMKAIYPGYAIDKTPHNPLTLTLEQLKDEDDNRWVEVPDDYLRTTWLQELVSNSNSNSKASESTDSQLTTVMKKLQRLVSTPKPTVCIAIEKRRADGTWPRDSADSWRSRVPPQSTISASD